MHPDLFKITPESIKDAIYHNREIEFELNGYPYFAEPMTNPPLPLRYAIFDCKARVYIFEGNYEDLLTFQFPSGETLADNFSCFDFLYIL